MILIFPNASLIFFRGEVKARQPDFDDKCIVASAEVVCV